MSMKASVRITVNFSLAVDKFQSDVIEQDFTKSFGSGSGWIVKGAWCSDCTMRQLRRPLAFWAPLS
jgi:hypothetical protein